MQTVAQFRGHVKSSHPYAYEEHVRGRGRELAYFSWRALLPIALLSVLVAVVVLALSPSDPYVYEIASFAAFDTVVACLVVFIHIRGRLRGSYTEFMIGPTLYRYLLDQCIICGEFIYVSAREEHLMKVHESEFKYHRFVKSILNAFVILSAVVTWGGLQLIFIFHQLSRLRTFVTSMGLCAVLFALFYLIYMSWLYRRWTGQWRAHSQAR